MKYLAANNSTKTIKTGKYTDYLQAIMYLIPDDQLCPTSKLAGCQEACLVSAGRGKFHNVRDARQRKTDAFKADPVAFVDQLKDDVARFIRKCDKAGKKPLVRLNGTSDIAWENYPGSDGVTLFDAFPHIQFADYTKLPNRKVPANYHLTVSYSEANAKYAAKCAKSDKNLAVVFKHALPKTFLGRPVIDGDKHDARPDDPKNVIVGLLAKGSAKNDKTGFVIDDSILAKSA
jgi:hypothetical protein